MSLPKKRRIVCVMPVEAVIGKIAKVNEKVSQRNPGFKCFVGYQRGDAIFNRFQVKVNSRKASYSMDEIGLQQKFKAAVENTWRRMQDSSHQSADQLAFSKQTKYRTLYGYIFSLEYSKVS